MEEVCLMLVLDRAPTTGRDEARGSSGDEAEHYLSWLPS
jgi:hypothetical protein